MQFRSRSGTIRVCLLSGHAVVIDQNWRELDPMFHADALKQGAECDQGRFAAETPKGIEAENPHANGEVTHEIAYRNAIATMLNRDQAGDFTSAGLPDIRRVSQLVGFQANKEGVYGVFHAMKAEADAAAAAEEAAAASANAQAGAATTTGPIE